MLRTGACMAGTPNNAEFGHAERKAPVREASLLLKKVSRKAASFRFLSSGFDRVFKNVSMTKPV